MAGLLGRYAEIRDGSSSARTGSDGVAIGTAGTALGPPAETADAGTADRTAVTPRGEFSGRWGAGRAIPFWIAVLGIAVVIGLLEAVQIFIGEAVEGRPVAPTDALTAILTWLMAAALVPGVFLLARHFPIKRGRWIRSVPVHLVGALGFAVVHLGTSAAVQAWVHSEVLDLRGALSFQFRFFFVLDMLVYGAIVGIQHALRFYRESLARERAAAVLRASLMEARLDALRGQLNPHFLFNTLNTISTMALKGERRDVADMLGRLGELLRISLDEGMAHEMPLAAEIEILDRYLDIQRRRFGDRLNVEMDIDSGALEALVPTMITQPLLENAIVHGVGERPGRARLHVRARRVGGRLELEVSDDGPGFGGGADGWGIGLRNTRERLRQLYGDDQHLHCLDHDEGGASVVLSVPLRTAPGSGSDE